MQRDRRRTIIAAFAKDERIENEEQDFVMDHRCIDGGEYVRRNGNQAADFR